MLAAAPHVGYIHEPFNVDINIGVNPKPFKRPFQYISKEKSEYYTALFDGIIHYKYPLMKNITKIRTLMDAADLLRDQGLFLLHKIHNNRPLIKDPIALFSAEWLYKKFNMNVLVMIRHPAAFCSSLKIKRWEFDFNHFLGQPRLMEKYLGKFEETIRQYAETERDIIDQAILLWNCIHYTISIYRKRHPEWLFVRHEDLSLDPVNQFQNIYESFGLEFTPKVKAKILETSGAHNPIEQQAGNEYVRNSRKNIDNWKKRLNSDEIKRIKKKTSKISTLFYSADAW